MASSLRILALLAIVSVCLAEYLVATIYEGTGCTGNIAGIYAGSDSACSSDTTCASVSSSDGGSFSVKETCSSSPPNAPAGTATFATYLTSGCTGNPETFVAFEEGHCVSYGGGSYLLTCSGSTLNYATYTCADCKCTAVTVSGSSGCASDSGVSVSVSGCGSSSSKCFHEDTIITYKEQQVTLPALLAGAVPACAVPHVKHSDGVSIRTACSAEPLRLTPDHLVYSARGLLLASELRVGDSLFADLGEQRVCNITSMDAEAHQRYFGLNCEESVVLANGIKTSAFGVYHTVPTAWMKIASSLVGVKSASAWGDAIANFLYDWSVV